ncbi:MAG: chorismate mutase, partial [Magnetococcus sp. WYHC-3]
MDQPEPTASPAPALPQTLEGLRAGIDAIDDTIHDLLMRRAQLVLKVGEVKERTPDASFYRPE